MQAGRVARMLASSVPHLAGEPVAERIRSLEKTVWTVGAFHVLRLANAEWFRPVLARERELLRELAGRVPLEVPRPVYSAPDGEFDVLFKASGEPVAPSWWRRLDPASQETIARQLGGFLAKLHEALPTVTAVAMGFAREFSPPSPRWVEERLEGHLETPPRRALLRDLLQVAPRLYEEALPPVLLHDDFSHHNVGFSDDGRRALGVFDFTQARIGDPHRDLRYAFTFEPFAEPMIDEYETVRRLRLDRRRLRAWHAWSAVGALAWELHHGDGSRLPLRWGWLDDVAEWDRDFLGFASARTRPKGTF